MTDLTPRTDVDDVGHVRRSAHRNRRIGAIVALLAVVAVIGWVLASALGDASQFFRNVDEAVAERDELGDRRFRLQGRVVPGTVSSDGAGNVSFQVTFGCEVAAVEHRGDPPALFDNPWIPVLLVGSWRENPVELADGPDTHVFASDELIVKHTNEYEADNGDRVESDVPTDFFAACPVLGRALEAASA